MHTAIIKSYCILITSTDMGTREMPHIGKLKDFPPMLEIVFCEVTLLLFHKYPDRIAGHMSPYIAQG